MSKTLLFILLLAVIGIAYVVLYTGTSITMPINAQNDSGESGTVVLSDSRGGAKIVITLAGTPEEVAQPAHIHEGTCSALGPVAFPLTSLQGGFSETKLADISLDQLLAPGPSFAINVHKSETELGSYVACGDIVPRAQ